MRMHDAREYLKLAEAIKEAPHNPPCMETDPELWFSSNWGEGNQAKKLCAICPVRKECLTYALATNQQDGIWGGLNLWQRRRLQAQGRDRRVGRPSRNPHPDSPVEHPAPLPSQT